MTEKNTARETYDLLGGMVFILSALVLVFLLAGRPFWVDGASMEPTFYNGDLLLVRSIGYTPARGDVVIFEKEDFRAQPVVKRIIALGGQTVAIDYAAGTVTVDGTIVDEPYINEWMEQQFYQTTTELTVPEGCLFVMGDNRNHSDDSRDPDCGPVDARLLLGQAVAVILPLKQFRIGLGTNA